MRLRRRRVCYICAVLVVLVCFSCGWTFLYFYRNSSIQLLNIKCNIAESNMFIQELVKKPSKTNMIYPLQCHVYVCTCICTHTYMHIEVDWLLLVPFMVMFIIVLLVLCVLSVITTARDSSLVVFVVHSALYQTSQSINAWATKRKITSSWLSGMQKVLSLRLMQICLPQ